MTGRVTPHGSREVELALWRWEMERSSIIKSPPLPDKLQTMQNNPNPLRAACSAGPKLVPVRFESTHPTAAASVYIAGTFNKWRPEAKTRHPGGKGRWWKEKTLAPDTYEYCLIVDGHWMPDPMAKSCVPNPFGGRNSVVKVVMPSEANHLADAENLPLKNENNGNNENHEQTNTSNQG